MLCYATNSVRIGCIAACAIVVLFNACTTTGGLHHQPGNISNVRASVQMSDNNVHTGYFTMPSNGMNSANLYLPANRSHMALDMQQVVSFTTDNGTYERKTLHKAVNGSRHTSFPAFVKRLTDPGALIHVYEYEELVSGSPKSSLKTTKKSYYATLPGHGTADVWDINGDTFSRSFNETMQQVFAADTRMMDQLQQKNTKYYYKPFSLRANDKVRILLNLNKDYTPGATSHSHAAN